jgi:XTP/dITP diphosphohydrolase
MELLIATTNPNKIKEIAAVLTGLPITFKTLQDFQTIEIPDETGTTFQANAREKALHYANATGCLTMAEDSGFEVNALNREPGIFSARYRRLRESGAQDRTARFVCALAVVEGGRIVFETTASVEGRLADAPAGSHGFGYDPIFLYPPYGKTFGEVSNAEKIAASHRGRAIRALREYLDRASRT